MKSLYEILGVSADASAEEILKAYRKRCRETHPDVAKGVDPEKFREVQTAFDILGDPQKRRTYDESGDANQAAAGMSRLEMTLRTSAAQMVEECAEGGYDLLTMVRRRVVDALGAKRGELREAQVERAQIERLKGRTLRKDGEGFNLFESAIEGALKAKEMEIDACEGGIKEGEAMLEILDGYESRGPLGIEADSSRRVRRVAWADLEWRGR